MSRRPPVRRLRALAGAAVLAALAAACGRAAAPPAGLRGDMVVPEALGSGVHELRANGVRLWYRVAGEPRAGDVPVVFLHGGPGQGSAHFDALAGPYLEPSLRMVYLDQRGSGHSERPASGAYSIDLLVQDVEALRRALGVERIAVLGHSFGAVLALEYAARHPEHTSHVIVASGLWNAPLQCGWRLRNVAERYPEGYTRVRGDTLDAAGRRRSDCELEMQAFPSDSARGAYMTASMFPDARVEARIDSVNAAHEVRNTGELGGALFSQGLMQYAFDRFDRLTMPVLVIAGGRDGAVPPGGLRPLVERLPDARLAVYEDAGHFVYLDAPERFARDVAAFVGGAR